jgi:hypothetical protein
MPATCCGYCFLTPARGGALRLVLGAHHNYLGVRSVLFSEARAARFSVRYRETWRLDKKKIIEEYGLTA